MSVQVWIAVFGLLLTSWGALTSVGSSRQKHLFLWGAVGLGISAVMDHATYFIALEIVVVSSSLLAFTPLGRDVKSAVPIVLGVAATAWLAYVGQLRSFEQWLGVFGLISLSMGYALSHPFYYFSGAIGIASFSYISYAAAPNGIALVFGLLNTLFAVTAGWGMVRYFRSRTERVA